MLVVRIGEREYKMEVVFFVLEVVDIISSHVSECWKIYAIKLIRAASVEMPDLGGIGLKEAKDLVDWVYDNKELLMRVSREWPAVN